MDFVSSILLGIAQKKIWRRVRRFAWKKLKKPAAAAGTLSLLYILRTKYMRTNIVNVILYGITSLLSSGITTLIGVQGYIWQTLFAVFMSQCRSILSLMVSPFSKYVMPGVKWATNNYNRKTSTHWGNAFMLVVGTLVCVWAYAVDVTPSKILHIVVNTWICRAVSLGVYYTRRWWSRKPTQPKKPPDSPDNTLHNSQNIPQNNSARNVEIRRRPDDGIPVFYDKQPVKVIENYAPKIPKKSELSLEESIRRINGLRG